MVEVIAVPVMRVAPEHGVFHGDPADIPVDRVRHFFKLAAVQQNIVLVVDLDKDHIPREPAAGYGGLLIKGEGQSGVVVILSVPARETVSACAVVFVEVIGIRSVDGRADLIGPVRARADRQILRGFGQRDVAVARIPVNEVDVLSLAADHCIDTVGALGTPGLEGPLRRVRLAALFDLCGAFPVEDFREQPVAADADFGRESGEIVHRLRSRPADHAVGRKAVRQEAQLGCVLLFRFRALRLDHGRAVGCKVDDLQLLRRVVGKRDAHRDLRGRLEHPPVRDDVDVKKPRVGDRLRVKAELVRRPGEKRLIRLRSGQDLLDPKRRPVRELRVLAVGQGDLVGVPVGRQMLLGDLRVRDPDREHVSVLHRDGQALLAQEGLDADQHPVPGGDRLRVDFSDLRLAQLRAAADREGVFLLQRPDGGVGLRSPDPDQIGPAELRLLHVGDKLFRLVADWDPVERQGVLLSAGLRSLRRALLHDAEQLDKGLQIGKAAAGQAAAVCFPVDLPLEVHGIDQSIDGEALRDELHAVLPLLGGLGLDLLGRAVVLDVDHDRRALRLRLRGLHGDPDGQRGLDLSAAAGEEDLHRVHMDDLARHGVGHGVKHLLGRHRRDAHRRPLGERARGRLDPDAHGIRAAGEHHVLRRLGGLGGQRAAVRHPLFAPRDTAQGNRAVGVALDDVNAVVRADNDAHAVGTAVAIKIEEQQIARVGQFIPRGSDHIKLFQALRPRAAVGITGQSFFGNARVMQAEGDEQGGPVLIGRAVPRAVPGIAPEGLILRDRIVVAALRIIELALRHGDQVLRPVAAQLLGKRRLPLLRLLQVGLGVGEAGRRVDMLLLLADAHPLIALLRVRVGFVLLQRADQLPFIAGVAVRVLVQAAESRPLHGDGREDQRIGRTEDHQAGQKPNQPSAPSIRFLYSG